MQSCNQEHTTEINVTQKSIPVIILCGGKGTRMGDRTIPKPLVEIGGRPVLWHVMKIYAAQGFTDFILALGYRGDMIKRYFLEYDWQSRDFTLTLGNSGPKFLTPNDTSEWRITFADTGMATQTGARIRKAARYVDGPRFFATYADGVADIDLRALIDYHRQRELLVTMTGAKSFSRFGILETDGAGRVTGFREKPLVDQLINGGFFVFERAALPYLEGGDDLVLEQAPFHDLARDGQLAVYEHAGFWRAMDTFKEAQELNSLWETDAPWKIW